MTIDIREITDDEVEAFDRDGVIILRNFLSRDDALGLGDEYGRLRQQTDGGFDADSGVENVSPLIKEAVYDTALPARAGKMLHANKIRLFETQLFTKEPGTASALEWHNDIPFWPVREGGPNTGVMSFWIAMTPVEEDMGPVSYVKGSHRWGWALPQIPLSDDPSDELKALKAQFESLDVRPLPDFLDLERRYPGVINGLITAILEPGDAVAFTGLTAHGSFSNSSTKRRMGLAARFMSEHVVFDPRANVPPVPSPALEVLRPGEPIDAYYPLLWAQDATAFEREKNRGGPAYKPEWRTNTVVKKIQPATA